MSDNAPLDVGALTPLTTQQAVQQLVWFSKQDHARFPLGWSVDDTCGMVGIGEMALIWARSGAGKSTLMLNAIANTPPIPTLVVNMEMTPRRQVEWLCSMSNELPIEGRFLEEAIKGGPDHPDNAAVMQALWEMQDRFPNLHFVTPSRPGVADLGILLEDIEADTGVRPQRVFIDHLGLLRGADDYSSYSRLTGELHSFAMQERVALYCVQQVKRTSGDGQNDGHKPVTLSSGVYAGEADADWIFGLYRPEKDPKYHTAEPYDKYSTEYEKWFKNRVAYNNIKGQVVLQVIKNRPYGELQEHGVLLKYDPFSRRLKELV